MILTWFLSSLCGWLAQLLIQIIILAKRSIHMTIKLKFLYCQMSRLLDAANHEHALHQIFSYFVRILINIKNFLVSWTTMQKNYTENRVLNRKFSSCWKMFCDKWYTDLQENITVTCLKKNLSTACLRCSILQVSKKYLTIAYRLKNVLDVYARLVILLENGDAMRICVVNIFVQVLRWPTRRPCTIRRELTVHNFFCTVVNPLFRISSPTQSKRTATQLRY